MRRLLLGSLARLLSRVLLRPLLRSLLRLFVRAMLRLALVAVVAVVGLAVARRFLPPEFKGRLAELPRTATRKMWERVPEG